MKKLAITSIVILAIGLAMIIVGAVLQGLDTTGNFNIQYLANALRDIGYVASALSGVVLVATGVSSAIDNSTSGKK